MMELEQQTIDDLGPALLKPSSTPMHNPAYISCLRDVKTLS